MLLALVHTWALVVVSLLDLGMSLNCLHHCHRVVVGCGDSQDLHVLHAWVQHLLHWSLELVFQLFFFPPSSLFTGCTVLGCILGSCCSACVALAACST